MSTNNVVGAVESNPNVGEPTPLSFVTGLELQGNIWRSKVNDDDFTVDLPGTNRYGNAVAAAAHVETVNGRTLAITGLFDADGIQNASLIPPTVKAAFFDFKRDPFGKSVVSLGGHRVRFALNPKTGANSPVAFYYILL
jgi:hypothetical protein